MATARGATVLGTVCNPESVVLFPVERERLKHLLRYRCYFTRLPYFGAACEEKNVDYEYAEPNRNYSAASF